jgi:SOS-response transcriptional repressor LexA
MEQTQEKIVRPTKKQQELLEYIAGFITEHGYSPSYREIRAGLNYNSVATVSLHVNNLIKRGHLIKRDHSARSLELTKADVKPDAKLAVKQLKTSEEKWLVDKVEAFFKDVETAPKIVEAELDHLYVLIGALKVLGVEGAATAFIARLTDLKKRVGENEYSV